MVPFETSKTRVNLMRAFAGESQARNRYTFAAALCEQNNLHLIGQTFLYTADQEREHAEIFYGFLSPSNGQNILMDAAFPVNTAEEVLRQLMDARHNELEEFETIYPEFARIAREEGFCNIADKFANIAQIERTHAVRFTQFARALECGTLFYSGDAGTAWLCLNCGNIHYGASAPKICPVCAQNQGFMIRNDLAPFVTKL